LHKLGYFGVFLALFFEAIGIPFPSETILVTSGVEMTRGVFHFVPLWIFAALGNIVGSNVAYLIGRFVGRTVILRYGRYVRLTEARLHSVEVRFQKFQALFLFGAKFIPFVRIVIPYLAGINGISYLTFNIYNTVAAFVWSFLFISLGHVIESVWSHYSQVLIVHWYLSVPAILIIAAGAWWVHKKATP